MGHVKFLGTAGARFVVARQLRFSAGTWIELGGTRLLLDPGPGTLLRLRKSRPPLDPTKLDAILLSHKHLDHSTDVNIMVEAMADGGYKRRGVLLAPADALEGDDPVVLRYVRPFLERIETWQAGDEHEVKGMRIRPVPHLHGAVETYGLVLDSAAGRIGFVTDCRFTSDLAGNYVGCQLLVLNVVMKDWKPDIDHLSLPQAGEIVAAVRPNLAVLTHFGTTMLRGNPRELAQGLSEKVGVEIIAAADGLTVPAEAWFDRAGWRDGHGGTKGGS
ncbi:MBL fold metallo-hydrolase [Candidatus Bipolaricaulota bacterium]|nr:MBL fold metallo-hydrolase [Candidatus Bipolaricaulota bacterium]